MLTRAYSSAERDGAAQASVLWSRTLALLIATSIDAYNFSQFKQVVKRRSRPRRPGERTFESHVNRRSHIGVVVAMIVEGAS